MALAQDDGFSQRYYSLSQTILDKKNEYYEILEKTQKSDGDITEWLLWFIGAVQSAVDTSGSLVEDTRFKAEYWRRFEAVVDVSLRQKKVINKLFEFGRKGMEGGLTTRKYIGWTKSSRATAWREIEALCQAGMLRQRGAGGRSTSYELPWPENTGDKKGRSS
ncbi:Fic family protein [uncultured Duodenibacillus sp.]|jgi:Fic family protein|uniref:Fic family protein n=1 Tax=uncultured Duodenibacillus sp. TaxID=1980699 RepID=UPI002805EDB9|nr:Fic family protein [uncultured Duodenibacillus sp.]